MKALPTYLPGKRLNRDAYLLCFSAFFADLGYQGVAALFPLYIVFRLHAPVFAYGIVTAVAFGGGSFFSYIGGLVGDRLDRKAVALARNTFIPLMAFSGIVHGLWPAAALFILGWWARYFRTPARRALLVNVTRPEERGFAFGFLHALDIGGGMLSALGALLLLYAGSAIGTIMLYAVVPLVISTVLLFFVQRTELHPAPTPRTAAGEREPGERALMVALLLSATLYGFSFYNLGFPILSATGGQATRAGYEYGVLAFLIYLGVSAASGYALGAGRPSMVRSVWLFGYLPSAVGSGLIGLSELLHRHLISSLVGQTRLARGMGFLIVSGPEGAKPIGLQARP